MTLKELHKQVGRMPFRATNKSYSDSSYLVEAFLSNQTFVAIVNGATSCLVGDVTGWQLVPEKKKALAYSASNGVLIFIIEGSKDYEAMEKSSHYTRQECFDIESSDV